MVKNGKLTGGDHSKNLHPFIAQDDSVLCAVYVKQHNLIRSTTQMEQT